MSKVPWSGYFQTLRDNCPDDNAERPVTQWLLSTFEPPANRSGGRSSWASNPISADGDIKYESILNRAQMWDEEGPSTVSEFLDAIECEVPGTLKNATITETLIGLTAGTHAKAQPITEREPQVWGGDYARVQARRGE